MKHLIKLLKNNLFRSYFFSSLTAYIGINIGIIGISWFIIDYTNKNNVLAAYTSVFLSITIVTTFLISGFIDQYNKSVVMKICNGLQGMILLVCFFFVRQNKFIIQIIFIMAVVNSLCQAVYNTASRGVIQNLIDKEDFIYGNSILEICIQGGAIIASFVTGIMYNKYGFTIILFVMGASLVMSAIFMKKTEIKSNNTLSGFKQMIEAIDYLKRHILYIIMGIAVFIPHMVTLLSNNVLPGYVKQTLLSSSVEFGIADMMFGAGAFVSGLMLSQIISNIKKIQIEYLFFAMSITSLVLLFFNTSVNLMYAIYFFFGLGNTSLKVLLNTKLMELIPEHIYGRCFSLFNATSSIIQITVVIILGGVLDKIPIQYGYLVLMSVMLAGMICISIVNLKQKNNIPVQEQRKS